MDALVRPSIISIHSSMHARTHRCLHGCRSAPHAYIHVCMHARPQHTHECMHACMDVWCIAYDFFLELFYGCDHPIALFDDWLELRIRCINDNPKFLHALERLFNAIKESCSPAEGLGNRRSVDVDEGAAAAAAAAVVAAAGACAAAAVVFTAAQEDCMYSLHFFFKLLQQLRVVPRCCLL